MLHDSKQFRRITSISGMLLVLGLASCQLLPFHQTPQTQVPPKRLVLGLDGVSYSLFKKLQEAGYFRDFKAVVPMLATYPSISDPNWTRLLNTEMSEGYTKSYFDRDVHGKGGEGEIRGNLLHHLKYLTSYQSRFDYKVEGFWESLATVTWVKTSALYWLDAMDEELLKSNGRETFFAFILNTDFISHLEGEKALAKYLVEVDKHLQELRIKFKNRNQIDLEIVLVSDHGNKYYDEPRMIDFEISVGRDSWQPRESLKEPNDFVFVAPEIISFGAFYTLQGREKAFAESLSKTAGIHSTAYNVDVNTVKGFSKTGDFEIRLDETKSTVMYKVTRGEDPFQSSRYFKKGPLQIDDYFSKSINDNYPFVAVRIWEAFHKNSQQAGSVLAEADPGFAFSNPTLRVITKFKGLLSMHGSLLGEESRGIFTSTSREFPPIRPQDFRDYIDLTDTAQSLRSKK